jgi:selenide,water dikinase
MTLGSGVGAEIWADRLPVWREAVALAEMGIIPAGCHTNRSYLEARVSFSEGVPLAIQDIMFDPQTSGGLLIAAPAGSLEDVRGGLEAAGVSFRVIGRMINDIPGLMHVLEKQK